MSEMVQRMLEIYEDILWDVPFKYNWIVLISRTKIKEILQLKYTQNISLDRLNLKIIFSRSFFRISNEMIKYAYAKNVFKRYWRCNLIFHLYTFQLFILQKPLSWTHTSFEHYKEDQTILRRILCSFARLSFAKTFLSK